MGTKISKINWYSTWQMMIVSLMNIFVKLFYSFWNWTFEYLFDSYLRFHILAYATHKRPPNCFFRNFHLPPRKPLETEKYFWASYIFSVLNFKVRFAWFLQSHRCLFQWLLFFIQIQFIYFKTLYLKFRNHFYELFYLIRF